MWLLFVFLLLLIVIVFGNKFQLEGFQTQIQNDLEDFFACQARALDKCQVPTLSTSQCFWSEYYKCPKYNGSYAQCTNNYRSLDKICECQNRGFEVCPYPYKISEKCYQEALQGCKSPTLPQQKYSGENLRVGMWYSDTKNPFHKNGWVLY